MKKFLSFAAPVFLFFINTNAQNVGIGTTIPKARLHVADSSVIFFASGTTPETPGNTPLTNSGRYLLWYADKAAFRSGYFSSTDMHKDSIGSYSFASGYRTRATGITAIAMGDQSIANGNESIALGFFAKATGNAGSTALGFGTKAFGNNGSTALGYGTTASGNEGATALGYSTLASGNDGATALGYATLASGNSGAFASGRATVSSGDGSASFGFQTNVSGNYAISMGVKTRSKAYGGLVAGTYNDTTNSDLSWTTQSTNRIFQIGNGTADNERSNALTVLQNGRVGIGELNPASLLEVNGEIKTNQLKISDNGTSVSNMQKGTFGVGTSAGAFKTVTVNFPNAFSSIPALVVTVRHEPGYNVNDTFTATIRSISNTSVTINIQRVDAAVGWGQNLLLDWIAMQ